MNQVQTTFRTLANTSSDINEHLPTLSKYASECESVFETGVRGCVSSWAFAHGLLLNNSSSKTLFMNDVDECDIGEFVQCTRDLPIVLHYEWISNLKLNLTQTFDLTFIDTWHVYGQLKRELAKFAPITNKYIIMHDTTVDEWYGEAMRYNSDANQLSQSTGIPADEINKGLWPAIEEFLVANPNWVLHERFTNNNGLTVLRRVRD